MIIDTKTADISFRPPPHFTISSLKQFFERSRKRNNVLKITANISFPKTNAQYHFRTK